MTMPAEFNLTELQNGSDIRGIAIQTKTNDLTLTDERIKMISYGLVVWLKEIKKLQERMANLKVAVGCDSRLSADRMKDVIVETLRTLGIDVIDVGLATTPAMFMSTQYKEFNCDAAIMITASHLPYEYNGLKFFTKDGGAEHEDITFILANAALIKPSYSTTEGKLIEADLLKIYAADLRNKIIKGIDNSESYENL